MAETTYEYSIANDTLNGAVATAKLADEIGVSSIVIALQAVNTTGDVLEIVMKDALSAGDETTLTSVIAAHDGIPYPSVNEVTIVDYNDTSRHLDISNDGKLLMAAGNTPVEMLPGLPGTPSGSTDWTQNKESNINRFGGTDTWDVVIPNGKTVTFQSFEVGAAVNTRSGDLHFKVILFWQPNGNTTDQEKLVAIYLQSDNNCLRGINRTYTGDGTARLHVEYTNWSSKAVESTSFIRGYY